MARSVVVDIIGNDDASPAFNKAAASAEESSGRMSTAFKGAIETAGKLGVALGAFELAKSAIDVTKQAITFQSDMKMIQAQAGASSSEVDQMSAALLKLAGPVATAPTALASGLYAVESAGQRGAVALNTLTIAAEGAKVGHADLTETADALVAAIQSGITGTQNAQAAMGALNATVGAGKMTLDDLNAALSTGVLPTVKGFGLSMNDVGAALADFGDQGIVGANAATDLRMAVQALAKPAATGAAEIKALGLTQAQLGQDMTTGGLGKALNDLQDHMAKAGVKADQVGQVLTDAFGKKAGVGLAVLEGNMSLYNQKVKQVIDGSNGFANSWTATQQTTSFALDKMKATAESLGISIATKLMPYVAQASTFLANNLPGAIADVSAVASKFGPVLAAVGGVIAAMVSASLPALATAWGIVEKAWSIAQGALGGISKALSGVAGFLSGHATVVQSVVVAVLAGAAAYKAWTIAVAAYGAVTKAVTAVTAAFNAVMDANPIMLVVIAVAALAAGLIYAYTHSKTFRDIVNTTFTDIKNVALVVVHALISAWDSVWSALRTAWNTVGKPIFDVLKVAFQVWLDIAKVVLLSIIIEWGFVWDALKLAWNTVGAPLFDLIGSVVSFWWSNILKPQFDAVVAIFQATWQTVTILWNAVGAPIFGAMETTARGLGAGLQWAYRNVLKPTGDLIAGVWSGISSGWNTMVDGLGKVGGAIAAPIISGINGLISIINDVITGLNKISVTVPSWSPIDGGKKFGINISHIPPVHLARGGMTTGEGVFTLGDNPSGQEVALPLDSPRTVSALAAALKQAGGGGRGGDTFNIYGQSDPVGTGRTIQRYQQMRAAV